MMLNINEVLVKEGFLRYFPLGLLLISIFLTELIIVFKDISLFNPIESGIKIDELLNQGNENTKALGLFLYTDFFIIFQISGFLLLVAMIGAIVLAQDDRINVRSQSISRQKRIQKKDIIKLK
jgi:NADH-quinone oxidoreductase subunit J